MSFGVGRFKTGIATGTGSAINVECGFVPKMVWLFNETDVSWVVWTDTMTDADMGLLDAASPALTYETSNGISAYSGTDTAGSEEGAGFTIGANSNVNGASDVIHYVAFG